MTDVNHTTNTGEPTTTKGGGPDSKIYGTAYYHKNISQKNEDNSTFSHNGGGAKWTSGLREREKWYCVEVHHVLNTLGKNNGVYQNWLDGVLVGDVNNVPQRADEKYNIDASSLVTFISPWGSDRDMNVYYDDWAVSDKRIGCQ